MSNRRDYAGYAKFLYLSLAGLATGSAIIGLLGLFAGIWTSIMLCVIFALVVGWCFDSFLLTMSLAASGCSAALAAKYISASLGSSGSIAGIPAGIVLAIIVFIVVLAMGD